MSAPGRRRAVILSDGKPENYDESGATMRVKVLSMVSMVDAKGDELTRIESDNLGR